MARSSAEALRGDVPDDLELHVCGTVLRFGFYNIGWQNIDKSRGIVEVQKKVLGIVVDHQVQVLALCEQQQLQQQVRND